MSETSASLRKAIGEGAQVLHNGAPVEYHPRNKGDRKPWVYVGDGYRHRYTSAQCQIYRKEK